MLTLSDAQKLEAAEQVIASLIAASEANGCEDIRSLAIMDHCGRHPIGVLDGAVMTYLSDPAEDGD